MLSSGGEGLSALFYFALENWFDNKLVQWSQHHELQLQSSRLMTLRNVHLFLLLHMIGGGSLLTGQLSNGGYKGSFSVMIYDAVWHIVLRV